MTHGRVAAVAFVVAFAISGVSHANPFAKPKSAEAKRHLKVGNKLLELQKFELAIKAYKDGYLVEGAPIFLYNLGLAHRKNGDLNAAIDYYRNFLNRARKARPDVLKAIRDIVDEMGAELKKRAHETTKLKSDRLKAKPDKPIVSVKRSPISSVPWYRDKMGWGISTGGLVVAGVGVGLLFSASGLRSDAESELNATKRDELRSSADTRQTWGTVLGLTGAAGLIVGIVKLIVHPGKGAGGGRGVDVALGSNWVGLRGSF